VTIACCRPFLARAPPCRCFAGPWAWPGLHRVSAGCWPLRRPAWDLPELVPRSADPGGRRGRWRWPRPMPLASAAAEPLLGSVVKWLPAACFKAAWLAWAPPRSRVVCCPATSPQPVCNGCVLAQLRPVLSTCLSIRHRFGGNHRRAGLAGAGAVEQAVHWRPSVLVHTHLSGVAETWRVACALAPPPELPGAGR